MSKIKTNYVYNVFYQILNIIMPLITAPYLSRILGAEKLGIYSYTFSIANCFLLAAMLGLNNYGNRTIAVARDDKSILSKTFWSIYWMQLFNATMVIIAYIIYFTVFAVENVNITSIAIVWLVYVVSAAVDISWFFFGMEQFKITVTRNAIVKLVSVILIFIFVKSRSDLWVYAFITASSVLCNQLLLWPFLRRYIHFEKVGYSNIFVHIKPNLLLFIPVMAISIYTIMDKIMIGELNTMVEAGFFENALKLMVIPVSLITALGTVMLPQISNLMSRGEINKIKEYISFSMQFTIFSSSAIAFGIAGIAPVFAPVFFGEEFASCSILMTMLSVTVIFIAWANVIRTHYLIPNNKDKVYVVSVILGAIINLIINIILIPKYGARGAAVGTIMAEGTVAVYQTIAVKHDLEILAYIKQSVIYLLFGLIMYIAVRKVGLFMGTSIITLLVQLFFGIVIYLGCCCIFFIKTNNSIGQMLQINVNRK